MNAFASATMLVLFACMVTSCAQPTQMPDATGDMIEPGDRVGDLLVAMGEASDSVFLWDMECEYEQGNPVSCEGVAGTNVNIAYGAYDDTEEGLDAKWSGASFELFLEDRPVNLAAFGTIDFDHPEAGYKMRVWNVVVVDASAGEFTVRNVGAVDDEAFDDTTTISILPAGAP